MVREILQTCQQPTGQPVFLPVKKPLTSAVASPFIQPVTGLNEMPVLQSTGLVSQITASQNQPTGTVKCQCCSLLDQSASLLASQLTEQETGIPEQELDQQLSEEQNNWETVRGVWSFLGWHQVPEFESSASFQDDNRFARPRTQPTVKYQ